MEKGVEVVIRQGIMYVSGALGVLKARVGKGEIASCGKERKIREKEEKERKRVEKQMRIGVSSGYKAKVKMRGVGYRAIKKDGIMEIKLGYKEAVKMRIIEGVEVETSVNGTIIKGKATKKGELGDYLGRLEAKRPARKDIYRGKGVVWKR
jgi:ribosomal protein L6P/L9E